MPIRILTFREEIWWIVNRQKVASCQLVSHGELAGNWQPDANSIWESLDYLS